MDMAPNGNIFISQWASAARIWKWNASTKTYDHTDYTQSIGGLRSVVIDKSGLWCSIGSYSNYCSWAYTSDITAATPTWSQYSTTTASNSMGASARGGITTGGSSFVIANTNYDRARIYVVPDPAHPIDYSTDVVISYGKYQIALSEYGGYQLAVLDNVIYMSQNWFSTSVAVLTAPVGTVFNEIRHVSLNKFIAASSNGIYVCYYLPTAGNWTQLTRQACTTAGASWDMTKIIWTDGSAYVYVQEFPPLPVSGESYFVNNVDGKLYSLSSAGIVTRHS